MRGDRTPIEWRFWPKVKIGSGCWEWTGARANGYGYVWDGNRIVRAHRHSFESMVGPIPDGMDIDHSCRNRACVNPDHLRACTRSQNLANTKMRDLNKSGFKGVTLHKQSGLWVAQLKVDGVRVLTKYFKTPEEAHAAYCAALSNHRGSFAYFGDIK